MEKTKKEEAVEYHIKHLYGDIEEHEKPMYAPDILQSKEDFKAGWEACERKKALEELTQNNTWIVVEEDIPHNDRNVLIKVKDYRRPEDNIFEVSIGYYDGEWRYSNDNFVNSGHGWTIHSWREIPQ